MSAPEIDTILVEHSPGEVRAVAAAGEEPWDIAIERPLAGPQPGDIYRARAGAVGPGGGRFFDLGGDHTGLARRPRSAWTEGRYGLVQVIRGDAGDKGPRVTDRVWLSEHGLEVTIGAKGDVDDRIEITRRIHHTRREQLRTALRAYLGEDMAVRIVHDPGPAERICQVTEALAKRFQRYTSLEGAPARLHAAEGEVGWLLERWPEAEWRPADLATAAWLAGLSRSPSRVTAPDSAFAMAIDDAVAEALTKRVDLDGGARLWIEPTRALVAIDVDRGSAAGAGAEINERAARECARQLRLRRLGGIVAIDFLRDGQAEAIAALSEISDSDFWPWAPPKSADPSGLVSFQRARMGASLADLTAGIEAQAYRALRLCVRISTRSGELLRGIRAAPDVIRHLQSDLAPAVRLAEQRLGGPLDLQREPGLGSIEIVDIKGEVLEKV